MNNVYTTDGIAITLTVHFASEMNLFIGLTNHDTSEVIKDLGLPRL